MRYKVNRGMLLDYLAQQYLAVIIERTAKGIDAYGKPFAPYAPVGELPRNSDGSIKRDAQGRWGERVMVQDPRETVTLRSSKDVKPGQHMMDNLTVSPWPVPHNANSVTIKAKGGRGGVGHQLRADTASGYLSGEPDTKREFLGHVDNALMAKLVRNFDRDIWGFIDKEGAKVREHWRAVARKRAERTRRQAQRRAKAAERTAIQKNRQKSQRLKALNIKPGETAKQAWTRSRSRRRKLRRDRRQINKDFAG